MTTPNRAPEIFSSTTDGPSGVSRRQVLTAAAVAAPAIVLTSAVPAHATSANSSFAMTLSATGIATGSPVDVTATVLDSRGDPWAGQVVTFTTSDPAALSFSSTSAVTDSAGRATVSVSAASNATAGTRSITAASGPLSASASIDVLAVTATASTGTSNPWSIAMSPTGGFAVAGHYNVGTVTVISTSTDTSVASIAVLDSLGSTISKNGAYALVCSTAGVYRINLSTNSITATVPVPSGYAYGVDISPDQSFAYVTTWGDERGVARLDLATNTWTHKMPFPGTGGGGTIVRIAPNGSFAYAIDTVNANLHRIDTASNTIVATTPIASAYGVEISPDSTYAYVTARNGFVHRVDTSTNAVVASISTPGDAVGLDISSDGSFAYSAHPDANVVRRIDTATNTVTATVPISGRPLFVAISPDDSFAYVTRNTAASVARIEWN